MTVTVDSKTGWYVCPMFSEPCRHCSIIKEIRPYTKIKPSTVGKFFEPAGIGKTTVIIGEFCNNDGTNLVQDLQYCPSRWGLRGSISMGTLDAPVGRFTGGVVTRAKKAAKVGKTTKKKRTKPTKRNTKKKRGGKRRVKRATRKVTLGKKKGVKSRGRGKLITPTATTVRNRA